MLKTRSTSTREAVIDDERRKVVSAHVAPKTVYLPDELIGVPELWRGDVVVAGGGSAGSTAAVAAARTGAAARAFNHRT